MLSDILTIPIELDKQRTLKYSWRAFRTAEQELTKAWGKKTTIPEILADLEKINDGDLSVLSFTDLGILIYSGLLHEDPNLELDYVYELLSFNDIQYITEKFMSAFGQVSIKDEEEQESPLASVVPKMGGLGEILETKEVTMQS